MTTTGSPTTTTHGLLPFSQDDYGVLDRLLNHNYDQGGTLALATGIQGSGKTTLIHVLNLVYLELGETLIWRGRPVDSWHAFPGPVKIWANYPLELTRTKYGDATPEPWTEPTIHAFTDAADLLEKLEPGALNVVYARETFDSWDEDTGEKTRAPTRFWDGLVNALANKPRADWHVLTLDEIHELWPDRPQGDDYHAQAKVRDALADFRKTFNTLLGATHDPDELDYRISAKLQFQVYTRGARPTRKSRVAQGATQNLAPGQAIVDSLHFAYMTYPAVPKPPYQVFARPAANEPTNDPKTPAEPTDQGGAVIKKRARARPRAPARERKENRSR